MKNSTKLFICIVLSIVVVHFLVSIRTIIVEFSVFHENNEILFEFEQSDVKNTINEKIKNSQEYYYEVENYMNKFSEEIGEEKPTIGLLIESSNHISKYETLIENIMLSIVLGILIGGAIYFVCINQNSITKRIIRHGEVLLVASIIQALLDVLYFNYNESSNIFKFVIQTGYFFIILSIPYIFIIFIIKSIYYIYQKLLARKLNYELKNQEDMNNLNKKIIISIFLTGVILVGIILIGLISFNSAINF